MRATRNSLLLVAWMVAVAAQGLSAADAVDEVKEPAKSNAEEPGSSLDDELLKDLEGDLGEGEMPVPKDGAKRGAPPDNEQPKATPPFAEESLDDQLMRDLEGESSPQDENAPLSKVSRAMREAQQLVAQAKGGKPTQELQGKIVADLERLLEAARKRQQQQSQSSKSSQSSSRQSASRNSQAGGAGGASDKPAQESSAALKDRAASRPDPGEMKDLLRDLWGHLPAHEREMVINSTIEQFLPKYELLIEAYFKRLAEETAPK